MSDNDSFDDHVSRLRDAASRLEESSIVLANRSHESATVNDWLVRNARVLRTWLVRLRVPRIDLAKVWRHSNSFRSWALNQTTRHPVFKRLRRERFRLAIRLWIAQRRPSTEIGVFMLVLASVAAVYVFLLWIVLQVAAG
jgi:hypothetical protein